MGKSNIAIRQWLSREERFADFTNGALFHGKQVFSAKSLKKEDGQQGITIETTEGKKIAVERYRDITMTADDGTRIVILACENQDEVHYAMPIRNMLYDALSYAEQVKELRKLHREKNEFRNSAEFLSGLNKSDLLYPVITIVFYYGEEEWDAHEDLHGLLGIDREEYEIIREYIPNYKINLVDPRNIEDLECFGKDLQMVFGMLKCRKSKTLLADYVEQNREYWQDIDEETCNAVKVLLNSEKLLNNIQKSETGGMNMCQALEELFQDGVNQGMERGIECEMERGIKALILDYKEDGFTRERIIEKLVKIYAITAEKAESYLTE